MKKTLTLFPALCFLFFLGWNSSVHAQNTGTTPLVSSPGNVITPELMKQYIDFLASDALLGRNTESPGLDTAAAFIVRNFKSEGIPPVNGNYYQYFYYSKTDLADGCSMTITKKGQVTDIPLKTGFIPFENTGNGSVSGQVVFAGYGITAPELKYDDYEGINAKGKVVVIFRHAPKQNDTASPFNYDRQPQFSYLANKMKNAVDHGAIALVILTEPNDYINIRPRGYPWPYLNKNLPVEALPMRLVRPNEPSIPLVHAGEDVINTLFGSVDELKKIQTGIDQSLKPNSFIVPDAKSNITIVLNKNLERTQNVEGFIEGSDPVLKNEVLVIGGHYDHIGYRKNHTEGEDYINNGADDNASGTAGTMAIAKAISEMKQKPKRSILFMLFAGEEKGLWGSDVYVNSPLLPLDKTVAMLNLDMISRNSIDSLELEGANLSPDITAIVEKANQNIGFSLKRTSAELGGSDHFNFYKKGIPFMFFFAGLHPDYHTVRDNPGTIDYAKAAKVSWLVLETALIIANDDKHYTLVKK